MGEVNDHQPVPMLFLQLLSTQFSVLGIQPCKLSDSSWVCLSKWRCKHAKCIFRLSVYLKWCLEHVSKNQIHYFFGWGVCLRIFRCLWLPGGLQSFLLGPWFLRTHEHHIDHHGSFFHLRRLVGVTRVTWWRLYPLMFQNHLKRQPATKRDFDWKKLKTPKKDYIYITLAHSSKMSVVKLTWISYGHLFL